MEKRGQTSSSMSEAILANQKVLEGTLKKVILLNKLFRQKKMAKLYF